MSRIRIEPLRPSLNPACATLAQPSLCNPRSTQPVQPSLNPACATLAEHGLFNPRTRQILIYLPSQLYSSHKCPCLPLRVTRIPPPPPRLVELEAGEGDP